MSYVTLTHIAPTTDVRCVTAGLELSTSHVTPLVDASVILTQEEVNLTWQMINVYVIILPELNI